MVSSPLLDGNLREADHSANVLARIGFIAASCTVGISGNTARARCYPGIVAGIDVIPDPLLRIHHFYFPYHFLQSILIAQVYLWFSGFAQFGSNNDYPISAA